MKKITRNLGDFLLSSHAERKVRAEYAEPDLKASHRREVRNLHDSIDAGGKSGYEFPTRKSGVMTGCTCHSRSLIDRSPLVIVGCIREFGQVVLVNPALLKKKGPNGRDKPKATHRDDDVDIYTNLCCYVVRAGGHGVPL